MADVLTDSEFRKISKLPRDWVDSVNGMYPPAAGDPTWITEQCRIQQAWVFAQLDKTYDTSQFADPFPIILKNWIAALVAADVILLLGDEPNQSDTDRYEKRADQARQDIKEAANAATGLYSLPLKQSGPTGVGRTQVRWHSTASPYLDRQVTARRGKQEDTNGGGTRG